mmetsp:Transcript_20635/g.57316  ORF Transcript_20635/g.57316 Transcript_20635/m.57316 type:complete len:333 (-) Transcript_20635:273-1271(-)
MGRGGLVLVVLSHVVSRTKFVRPPARGLLPNAESGSPAIAKGPFQDFGNRHGRGLGGIEILVDVDVDVVFVLVLGGIQAQFQELLQSGNAGVLAVRRFRWARSGPIVVVVAQKWCAERNVVVAHLFRVFVCRENTDNVRVHLFSLFQNPTGGFPEVPFGTAAKGDVCHACLAGLRAGRAPMKGIDYAADFRSVLGEVLFVLFGFADLVAVLVVVLVAVLCCGGYLDAASGKASEVGDALQVKGRCPPLLVLADLYVELFDALLVAPLVAPPRPWVQLCAQPGQFRQSLVNCVAYHDGIESNFRQLLGKGRIIGIVVDIVVDIAVDIVVPLLV